MAVTSPVVFACNKTGSPYIQLVHSAGQFRGDPFNPVEYQGQFIGFVGGRIMGVSPIAILLEVEAWNWTKAKVVKDIVRLTDFFSQATNKGLVYTPKQDDRTWKYQYYF